MLYLKYVWSIMTEREKKELKADFYWNLPRCIFLVVTVHLCVSKTNTLTFEKNVDIKSKRLCLTAFHLFEFIFDEFVFQKVWTLSQDASAVTWTCTGKCFNFIHINKDPCDSSQQFFITGISQNWARVKMCFKCSGNLLLCAFKA